MTVAQIRLLFNYPLPSEGYSDVSSFYGGHLCVSILVHVMHVSLQCPGRGNEWADLSFSLNFATGCEFPLVSY